MNSIEFINLTLGYNRHPAVHHLNGAIAAGELLAIVGPNGGGKSTLLKAITGELRPLEGEIHYADACRRHIASLSQQHAIDLSFPLCVYDVVASGLWREIGLLSGLTNAHRMRVESALQAVKMLDFASKSPRVLSGGQIQRMLFARALVENAPLLVLDEPFTALDRATTDDLLKVLLALNHSGTTVVVVLHDMRLVKDYFPRTLILARELIAHGATQHVFSPDNLSRARHMPESFDELAHICHLEPRQTA